MECLTFRVKDIDIAGGEIRVRVRTLHDRDRERGRGRVALPTALYRKADAGKELNK